MTEQLNWTKVPSVILHAYLLITQSYEMGNIIIIPYYIGGETGAERLSNWSEVTQLESEPRQSDLRAHGSLTAPHTDLACPLYVTSGKWPRQHSAPAPHHTHTHLCPWITGGKGGLSGRTKIMTVGEGSSRTDSLDRPRLQVSLCWARRTPLHARMPTNHSERAEQGLTTVLLVMGALPGGRKAKSVNCPPLWRRLMC